VLEHDPPDHVDYDQDHDQRHYVTSQSSHDPHSPFPDASAPLSSPSSQPNPPLTTLPYRLHQSLLRWKQVSLTPAKFRLQFNGRSLAPMTLASTTTLVQLCSLWLSQATPSDWAWLGGQLGHMVSELTSQSPQSSDSDPEVLRVGQALRAYALAVLEQDTDARATLFSSRDERPDWQPKFPLSLALHALTRARLDEWQLARREMAQALRCMVRRDSATSQSEASCLDEYARLADLAGREEEIVDLLVEGGKTLRHIVISGSRHEPGKSQIADFFFSSFTCLRHPADWLTARLGVADSYPRWIGHHLGPFLLKVFTSDPKHAHDALLIVHALQAAGIRVPVDRALQVAYNLSRVGSHKKAIGLVAYIREQGLSTTSGNLARMLRVYSSAGDVESADAIYRELEQTDQVQSTNRLDLALAYAGRGNVTAVANLLSADSSRPIDRDISALRAMHLASVNAVNVELASAYFDKINALQPSVPIFNRMISFYAALSDVDNALDTFNSLLDSGLSPDCASYTSIIALFAHRRDLTNARNVFQALLDAQIVPDAIAWAAMLNAEVEAGNWLDVASRYATLPSDIQSHISVATVVLKAFVLLSTPTSQVLALYRSIKEPTGYLWALAIQSAVDNRDITLARDLYEEMDSTATELPHAPQPDVYTFSILLHAYFKIDDMESARAVYDEMLKREIIPSSVTYAMIIDSYASATNQQSFEMAHDLAMSIHRQATAERNRARGTVSENLFGPLVDASARAGETDLAKTYFDLATSTSNSIHMYTKLMDAYRRAGRVESVLDTWGTAFRMACENTSFKVKSLTSTATTKITWADPSRGSTTTRSPDNLLCFPLSVVLDSLSSVGRHADIQRVWSSVKDAGFGFDSQNYNHYAVALARTGDIEEAFKVVERILIPRWSAIRDRRIAAKRMTQDLPPAEPTSAALDDQGESAIADLPVSVGFRPPNRRHEHRWDQSTELAPSMKRRQDANTVQTLVTWRPTDVLWRPSFLTMSVLEHAYRQLEEAKFRGVWVGLPADEGEMEGDLESESGGENGRGGRAQGGSGAARDDAGGVITFPSFGNAPLRDAEGNPRKISPGAMIARLNRKYFKVMAMISLYRRKKASRLEQERKAR
jgi:pentatricopeptide repeat-containing protein PET309